MQKYEGQIFTCSALRFAEEFQLTPELNNHLGGIRYIEAVTPKSWHKYAVHIIEPVLKILKETSILNSQFVDGYSRGGSSVFVQFENDISARFTALGSNAIAPLSLRIFGNKGWVDLVFSDTFSAFKKALSEFLDGRKLMRQITLFVQQKGCFNYSEGNSPVNKTLLLTGGSGKLGKVFLKYFKKWLNIVATSRDEKRIDQLCSSLQC